MKTTTQTTPKPSPVAEKQTIAKKDVGTLSVSPLSPGNDWAKQFTGEQLVQLRRDINAELKGRADDAAANLPKPGDTYRVKDTGPKRLHGLSGKVIVAKKTRVVINLDDHGPEYLPIGHVEKVTQS